MKAGFDWLTDRMLAHISHIETGNSVPSVKTLIDIINALDCSADELLCIEIKKQSRCSTAG